MGDDKDMSLGQIAKLCDVSRTTVYRWIQNGHLKSYTLPSGHYRVKIDDLSAFCQAFGIPDPMADPIALAQVIKEDEDRAPLPPTPPSDPNRLRVLIADDDPGMLLILRQVVEQELPDSRILESANGVETCVIIGSAHPHLLLLDIMMPGMDGFAVLRDLLARPEMAECRVVVISAFEPFARVAELERRYRQVVACVPKPAAHKTLSGIVREAAQDLKKKR